MDKYGGIDLHSNNCVVVVIDSEDRVCCECGPTAEVVLTK
ncbi:MAG: hypothetical protein JWP34_1062 [Massilia sp.]|nr:hypothetical protein [Massilia sp.]